MAALGRLSIRTRLYFGKIFSLVLLVLIGALGFIALDHTRGTLKTLFSQRVQTLTDMSDLRTSLGACAEPGKASSPIVLAAGAYAVSASSYK